MRRFFACARLVSGYAGLSVLAVIVGCMLLSGGGGLPRRMRSFSKRVINPLVLGFAGSRRGPFAVVRHVGRCSGRAYETPLLVVPVEGGFVVELTYGFEVDWYRNVVAMGYCNLRWHGKDFVCADFEPVVAEIALSAFPLALRLPLRLLGAQHFVRMRAVFD